MQNGISGERHAARLLVCVLSLLFHISSAHAAAGRTPGSFAVSPTGAATYTIPIWTPPGPAGVQPRIALVYNSHQGNGPLGVGWSLSGLSSIYRCNGTYAQDGVPAVVALTAADAFCKDGNRLRLTSGAYGQAGSTYQTEIADFSNITAYGTAGNGPAYFIVQDRNGRSYQYGNGGNSQVLANGTTTAASWLLNQVSDPAGNTMAITYAPPDGTLVSTTVPETISWAPSAYQSSTYNYTMQFSYTVLPVPYRVGYIAASPLLDENVLTRITISSSVTTVKNYFLGYSVLQKHTDKEFIMNE